MSQEWQNLRAERYGSFGFQDVHAGVKVKLKAIYEQKLC